MNPPVVSVLMTAYNRDRYISEAIDSVLASSFTDFELIIVDDCSTDNTLTIARQYEKKDTRVKVYVNEKNLGQFPNRNYAASLAQGRYLKYIDSDDLIYPNGLKILVETMEKFPEAGFGICSLEQDEKSIFPFVLNPAQSYERHFLKNLNLFNKAPLSSIFRTLAFNEIGGFGNAAGEGDYEILLHLSASHNVVLMQQGLVWYRMHEEQIDYKRRTDPAIRFRYFLVTLKYLDNGCPLTKAQANQIKRVTHENMVKFILIILFKGSPRDAYRMYKLGNYHFGQFLQECMSAFFHKIAG